MSESDLQSLENAPLPPLITGDVDLATLEQYFHDLRTYAQIDLLRCKYQRNRLTPEHQPSLDQAREDLRAGVATSMQISYRYDGEAWRDTVMSRGPGHWHLVRLREADLASGQDP